MVQVVSLVSWKSARSRSLPLRSTKVRLSPFFWPDSYCHAWLSYTANCPANPHVHAPRLSIQHSMPCSCARRWLASKFPKIIRMRSKKTIRCSCLVLRLLVNDDLCFMRILLDVNDAKLNKIHVFSAEMTGKNEVRHCLFC